MSTTPLRFLSRIIAGQSPDSAVVKPLDEGLPFLQGNAEFGPVYPSARWETSVAPKRAERGDVLVSVRAPVGAVNIADRNYGIGRGLCAIRPIESHSRYIYWWLLDSRELLNSLATGSTFGAIAADDLKGLRVPIADRNTQFSIAAFLDRETAEIDAFIADQEELIALLAERRAATITRAVTKGLNPSVPMRDSGVPPIGAIPSSWEVMRIAASIESVKNGTWGSDPGGAHDLRCVRVADFDRASQSVHDRNVTFREVLPSDRVGRILRRGDLLLEKSGGGDNSPVGFVVLFDSDEPAVSSNFVARMRLKAGMDPRFWTYVHGANYRSRLTRRSIKQSTGIQNLDSTNYFNEAAAVPPCFEQIQIADYLDRETGKLDATVADALESIALSKERRAALISAAVTGKIDVRGAA